MLMLVCATVTVEAQFSSRLFPAFSSFRVIRTEKFDIIFPEESEPSARLLAAYADSVYEEISLLFGINVPGRIPVTFAPYTDLFNGYYNPISSPHIVLFDTPVDLEWTTFDDNLKALFIHELVHAITLNTRGPFFRFLSRIFGNWVTPAFWNAPAFMVEGAAISLESLSGFGRSSDPYIRQILRQAIHEGKFHTPFQASGVYDSPGQSGLFYEYGGLFSSWLQQQYGMEKYAQLWQEMGSNGHFSFFVYRSGFYGIFKKVYGIDFTNAWNSFRDSITLSDIEEAPQEILPVQYRFFSENRNSFPAITAYGNEVFILNRTQEKIHVYDTQAEKTRSFNTSSMLSYDLDVSPCGKNLLISGYRITGDRYSAFVTEHRTDSGNRTGRTFTGLYRARYFRDGVIALASELHNNCIVFEDFYGNREILFRGNEGLMFSGPQAVDNERIVFIAAQNGVRTLIFYNYISGELFRIESFADDNEYSNLRFAHYMRSLSVSEGKLLFSHNVNDRMYKLAVVDLEAMQVILSDRDFSGGVFNPVSVNGNVYYRGMFFSGDGILRFPEIISSISGTQIDIKLVPVKDYDLVPVQNTQKSSFDIRSRDYSALKYMSPFNFWLPLPLIRMDDDFNVSFDGGGLVTIITDPTDRNVIIAFAYADVTYRIVMIDDFLWQNTLLGFPITLEFSDKVLMDTGFNPYRETRINLNASFSYIPERWLYGLSLGGGYIRVAADDEGSSAYEWEEMGHAFYYTTSLTFSNIKRRQHELFGTGISLVIRGANIAGTPFRESFQPRIEGRFRSSIETRFPLNLVLYGAYDVQGMTLHGVSQSFGQSIFNESASVEYSNPSGINLNWLAGAEVSLGLFSFEIQRNLSHLYFNRFFGALALRNVLYDSGGHFQAEGIEIGNLHLAQSLVLKLGLVSSVIPIKYFPLFVEPNIWGAWKFSNTITGSGSPWDFGVGFNIRY